MLLLSGSACHSIPGRAQAEDPKALKINSLPACVRAGEDGGGEAGAAGTALS